MTAPNPARAVLSADRREMTVITLTPEGIHRAVLVRADDVEPFTDADVERALAKLRPTLTIRGQRNTTRRWATPFGTVYGHLMLGPPTWWLPKIQLRGDLMVGWFRLAVAVGFRREGESR